MLVSAPPTRPLAKTNVSRDLNILKSFFVDVVLVTHDIKTIVSSTSLLLTALAATATTAGSQASLVSFTSLQYTDTVIIADAFNPPVTKASSGFNGDYLIDGGQGDVFDRPCGGFGGETHFSIIFRNVILDTTSSTGKAGFTALSWAVAQNCALVNVKISMPQSAHTGMVMGPGSIISVSDVHFTYGNVGLHWAGHQQ
ncbi:Glucan endo-1,3-beta-glucosidase BGN13.1 [Beauveria bassiana]|nr:Glucan endo-1,3-beta-glucosidase BGN13.1 [Beauveria bassiana]